MNPPRPKTVRSAFITAALILPWLMPAALAQQARSDSEDHDAAKSDQVTTLSPFEVVADAHGYFSPNTMSGTRFNTKLEDLASSLTVVTKQQMTDFAMLDINDIFLYTANTEGTGTYTDFVIDRSGQQYDNVQLNPTGANRVRGIAPANVAYNNFETMGRVPVDPLTIESVEIGRGPNANVFGLGNPSGTVNMVPATANLSRNRTEVTGRADSYSGYRATLDMNRVLIKNKLAIRASGGFQHEGFVRKPSGMNTERYNAMVKYRPFPKTTISATYQYYRMNGNRPNYMTPRDNVSYWLASGKPTWDPIAEVVHVNGTTLGPFTTATGVPDYFNAAQVGARTLAFVGPNGLSYWTTPTTNSVVTGPTGGSQSVRLMATTPAAGAAAGLYTSQPLFSTVPALTNKSIYDWSSVNLASVNRQMDKTDTYMVQLDQLFFNTPRNTLAAQLGFFREDSERYVRTPIGNTGVSGVYGQLQVDPNERLLDGSPNPFVGKYFITAPEPVTRELPATWDTYRAQLAYKLDLRKEKSWLKWLGWHQFTGYDEYKYRIDRTYGYRDTFVDNHAWIPAGSARGNDSTIAGGPVGTPAVDRVIFRYYVSPSDSASPVVAPTDFSYGPSTFVWGRYNTFTGGVPVPSSAVFNYEPAVLGQVATTDVTGGSRNTKQIIKTQGAVWQSHFLGEKIVGTIGIRQDKTYTKSGATPQLLTADGMHFDYDSLNHWEDGDYASNGGRTKTAGVVVRPFRDWSVLRRGAQGGGAFGFLSHLLQGLGLTYNQSDSFTPATPAEDLTLRRLPNPSGEGKDYGFWLDPFDGKLVVRLNHYENTEKNSRNDDANIIAQRVLRIDGILANDRWQLNGRATDWVSEAHPTWTPAQVQDEVATETGIPTAQFQAMLNPAFPIGATNDITAKGNELEINYNPTKYWTVVFAGAETQAINTNVSTTVSDWIAARMPYWLKIVDPRTNTPWWTTGYGGPTQLASRYYTGSVETPSLIINEQQGKAKPEIRRYSAKLSTSFKLRGITERPFWKGVTVGGALRWEDKGAIGYYGVQSLPDVITALDPDRPIWDKAHFYVDTFIGYRTTLFANRIGATFRLNVRNLQESGRLQAVGAFPDGTPHSFRIVDPRQFILQASFDL